MARKIKPPPPLEVLEKSFAYIPERGVLRWKVKKQGVTKGQDAGCIAPDGYVQMHVAGKSYLAHRIIWYMHYRTWPDEIDHINGDKTDNRIENLREVTCSQNMQNKKVRKDNRLGVKGVYWVERDKGYNAQLTVDGKQYWAYFKDLEDAITWREVMEQRHHTHRPSNS